MHPLTSFVLVFSIIGFVATWLFKVRQRSKYEAPGFPGPYQLPWIGRIHDLPIQYMWLKFKQWADEYGPIYHTSMLGAHFLVVSDEQIAHDLLVKRAKTYSDRPVIRSLFDSKSTDGSMEYLPLMGKNSKSFCVVKHHADSMLQSTGQDKESSRMLI